MLLIIILGLIAKLALVSCDCDIGPLPMNDFDYTKFSDNRTWCSNYHNSDDIVNKLDCLEVTLSRPDGNISVFTSDIYDTREQRHVINDGNATNWNSSGCLEVYHPVGLLKGTHCVIATNYDGYCIVKVCPPNSNKPYIYVASRSCHPDEATENDMLKALKDNNIDVGQLVEFSTDHCQQTE